MSCYSLIGVKQLKYMIGLSHKPYGSYYNTWFCLIIRLDSSKSCSNGCLIYRITMKFNGLELGLRLSSCIIFIKEDNI